MIFVQELLTKQDFKSLKKGDYLAVKFKREINFDTKKPYTFKIFQVYKNIHEEKEIVLQKKNNIYFSYAMFLEGNSNVESVTLIKESNLKFNCAIAFDDFKNERHIL